MDLTSEDTMLACGTCQANLLSGDRYCERCGTRVGTAVEEETRDRQACATCGAPPEAISSDWYCTRCGARQRSPHDRREIDLIRAAGVTDRGRVHRRNEDSLHLQTVGETGVAAVVCDGISSSLSPDRAAQLAANAAGTVLVKALGEKQAELVQTTRNAVNAAQEAVLEVPWTSRSDLDVPSCTLVSAIYREGELVIGCVGDSRAYWIAPDDSRQLTADHSWAQEQVKGGLMSAEEAATDRRAHSITRWLGRDAPEEELQIVTMRPTQPGRLLLCTDGLWNYTPDAAGIVALLDALPSGAAAITAANSLADAALAAGGHDNITVTIIDVRPVGRDAK
jgi:serine/threonine protein phosphatase PrpC